MKKNGQEKPAKAKSAASQEATELLQWLVSFLPAATPRSMEEAILDESEDVHSLLWHRSELQQVLEQNPEGLTRLQLQKLAQVDEAIRRSALLFLGAEKGSMQRYRQGRYDRSHWWWYLDNLLQEEFRKRGEEVPHKAYATYAAEEHKLSKVAEQATPYRRRGKPGKGRE